VSPGAARGPHLRHRRRGRRARAERRPGARGGRGVARRGRPRHGAARPGGGRARARPARLDARAVDLLDEAATRDWAAALRERFGAVDGVLHLVGGWRGGTPLAEAPLEDWALLHDLLIRTVQHTSRAFRDDLAGSPHGRFVSVSALQAQKPSGTNAAYGAAKAAAEAWTLALADDLSGTGATANIVIINALVTPQMRAANPDKAYKTFTDAGEIAETIAWLCSDAARKMNGRRVVLA
jgi:NAD(P)-dependent dehydrogenase (short-subunit alcohol dehydrogenase family)